MKRVAEFEIVSFAEFYDAMKEAFYKDSEKSEDELEEIFSILYVDLDLPVRATAGSAGHDFRSPISFTLNPGESIKIPTGVRARIDKGWWLSCLPRSSLGFQYHVELANTVGVVDSDYYYSDNEGHIFLKITNRGDQTVTIGAGDRFAQGIFLPYGITYDDDVKSVRNGGMGSTDHQRGACRDV